MGMPYHSPHPVPRRLDKVARLTDVPCAMGLRAVIGAALMLGSSGVVAFAACRGTTGSTRTLPPPPGSAASTPATVEPPTASVVPASDEASPAEQLKAAVAAARGCEAPSSVIVNRPDGGVVFNNAMTSADAGSIDRGQAVIDALVSQTDAFRCCFDAGLGDGSNEARVLLTLQLAPDGAVTAVTTDPARSTLKDDVALACLTTVAGEIAYPPSPSDQPTVVEYPLVARAR